MKATDDVRGTAADGHAGHARVAYAQDLCAVRDGPLVWGAGISIQRDQQQHVCTGKNMARPHATGVALTTTVCMLTSSVASLGHTSSPRRRPGRRHRRPRSTRRRTWRSSTSVHSPWLRSIRRFRSSTALLSPLRSHATRSCRTPAPPGPATALPAQLLPAIFS